MKLKHSLISITTKEKEIREEIIYGDDQLNVEKITQTGRKQYESCLPNVTDESTEITGSNVTYKTQGVQKDHTNRRMYKKIEPAEGA